MNDYAVQTVASLASSLLTYGNRSKNRELIKQLLPYCITRVGAGDEFILLNREYKPLGFPPRRREFLDYSRPEFASWRIIVPKRALSPLILGRSLSERGEFFHFYGGETGPAPWSDAEAAFLYFARLREVLGIGGALLTREGVAQ